MIETFVYKADHQSNLFHVKL